MLLRPSLKKSSLTRPLMFLVMVGKSSHLNLKMNLKMILVLTTVELNPGASGMGTYNLPVGSTPLGPSSATLPAVSPLGTPLGGTIPAAPKPKRSRNRAHKKHHKKTKSKKAARSSKPKKTCVVRPSKMSSSSSSDTSEDDEPGINPQQV